MPHVLVAFDQDLTLINVFTGGMFEIFSCDLSLADNNPQECIVHFKELQNLIAQKNPDITYCIVTKGKNRSRSSHILNALGIEEPQQSISAFDPADPDYLDPKEIAQRQPIDKSQWGEYPLMNLPQELNNMGISVEQFKAIKRLWDKNNPGIDIGKTCIC